MTIKEYMDATFPGLILKPSLYHQWHTGIHFELAKEFYQFKDGGDKLNPAYFNQVQEQCLSLFNEIFSEEDQIFLVTNLYHHEDFIRRSRLKMKVYRHFIKDKALRFQIRQETLPYMFDDEEEATKYRTAQFSLACRKKDIDVTSLIKAISHQDFPPLKPRFHNPYRWYDPDVFLINASKNIILYIYDDRGCEVIAKDIGAIRPLYETYKDWVDEHYIKELDQLFLA